MDLESLTIPVNPLETTWQIPVATTLVATFKGILNAATPNDATLKPLETPFKTPLQKRLGF